MKIAEMFSLRKYQITLIIVTSYGVSNCSAITVITRSLTLKGPITTAADNIHKYFFIVFQRKQEGHDGPGSLTKLRR